MIYSSNKKQDSYDKHFVASFNLKHTYIDFKNLIISKLDTRT